MLKILKEIRGLASAAQCDMADVLAYGSLGKTEEEEAALESTQAKIHAILRSTNKVLEVITGERICEKS